MVVKFDFQLDYWISKILNQGLLHWDYSLTAAMYFIFNNFTYGLVLFFWLRVVNILIIIACFGSISHSLLSNIWLWDFFKTFVLFYFYLILN